MASTTISAAYLLLSENLLANDYMLVRLKQPVSINNIEETSAPVLYLSLCRKNLSAQHCCMHHRKGALRSAKPF